MNRHTSTKSGFTLVEMVICLGILVMMMSIVLASYRSFGTNAKFTSASEDIVLALREAQVYGVSTKGYTNNTCGGTTTFNCSYGVYFANGTNGFTVFVDQNNDKFYNSGASPSEAIPTSSVTWASNISVTDLSCDGFPCTNGNVSVTFKRPNVNAYIEDLPLSSSSYNKVKITLTDSNTSATSTVTISSAGQISLN